MGITIAVFFSSTRALSLRRKSLSFCRSLKGFRHPLLALDKNDHVQYSSITVVEDIIMLCCVLRSMRITSFFFLFFRGRKIASQTSSMSTRCLFIRNHKYSNGPYRVKERSLWAYFVFDIKLTGVRRNIFSKDFRSTEFFETIQRSLVYSNHTT